MCSSWTARYVPCTRTGSPAARHGSSVHLRSQSSNAFPLSREPPRRPGSSVSTVAGSPDSLEANALDSAPHARVLSGRPAILGRPRQDRSEEHTSELQSLLRISYAVFCLKKTNKKENQH